MRCIGIGVAGPAGSFFLVRRGLFSHLIPFYCPILPTSSRVPSVLSPLSSKFGAIFKSGRRRQYIGARERNNLRSGKSVVA